MCFNHETRIRKTELKPIADQLFNALKPKTKSKKAPMAKRVTLTLMCGTCGRRRDARILITQHTGGRMDNIVAQVEPCECAGGK